MPKRSKISVIPADETQPHHNGILLVQGIPEDTKLAFKAACARVGETMRDVIIKIMREYAAKHGH